MFKKMWVLHDGATKYGNSIAMESFEFVELWGMFPNYCRFLLFILSGEIEMESSCLPKFGLAWLAIFFFAINRNSV